ncbi:2683_t:CDS:2, partial [Gigaspora margarita]
EILQQPDMALLYSDLAKDFKASYRWLVAFMKRNGFALRHHTKTAQKLPKESQKMLESFYKVVTELREEKSYKLGNIFNMNETPVWFDMVSNFTINPKGEKTVYIRMMGNDKNRFIVVLTYAAGGAEKTPKGNLRRARISNICTWIKHSWERISEEIIIKSFKTCQIVDESDDESNDLEIIDLCNKENTNDEDDDKDDDDDDNEDDTENDRM